VSCVGTTSSTVIAVAVLDLGQRRTARPGLVAGGGIVRLLGAVAGGESVMAADALDRGRRVGRVAAPAADPERGANISGRCHVFVGDLEMIEEVC
jgi:hypothetical protein